MSGVINIRIIWGNYLIRLAKDYETEKRWKDSYIAFNEAILCDSRNYRYYQFRGKMLEGLFREKPLKNVPEEVIRSYKTSIELNKLDSYCWADLGRFLGYMTENYNRAMFSEAEKAYQKAIGLDPYNPLFYNDLANLYAQLGKDERALEFYQKGYELYPQSSTINVNLAVYYMGRKDFHSARIHLEKVLEIEPENKKALKLLEELTKNEEKEKHESHK
jgi:tetratricopeptide (TPR) repeat protein